MATALGDKEEWERVADSVVLEVRRHVGPSESSRAAALSRGLDEAIAQEAVAAGPVATAPVPQDPSLSAATGSSPTPSVHVVYNNSIATQSVSNTFSTSTANCNNQTHYTVPTSIVLIK